MDLLLITNSKEIIKPSSPTPEHQRTHKLSLLDQLNHGDYFSFILFYPQNNTNTNTKNASDHLKRSLSETLTRFYPLAGRVTDNRFVDCDDHGVIFIETQVAGHMSEHVGKKELNLSILEQLVPCKPGETTVFEHNLMVQVNFFGCGGMAIGLCFHHKVADAATATNFVNCWGLLARGRTGDDTNDFNDMVYDVNSIFPAHDSFSDTKSSTNPRSGSFSLDSVVKRFTFDGNKIASLREKIVNESLSLEYQRPSRFEVVSSVILGALLAAYKGSNGVTAIMAVNLRKRMNPPLPEQSFGNICGAAILNLENDDDEEKRIKYCSLAGEIHRSIKMVDAQFVRKLYGEGEILNEIKRFILADDEKKKSNNNNKVFVISSWCKMPLYEADFGWGKPTCIGLGRRFSGAAVLVDSSDGEGIEAWIELSKQDMSGFEKHPDILDYASCSGQNN